MNIDVHLSVATDIVFGLNLHTALNPSMGIVTPVELPSIETPVNMDWPTGKCLHKHKIAANVTILDVGIVQSGHDVGPFTFDITPYPIANPWYLVMWPFASRKTSFGCFRVQVANTPGLRNSWDGPSSGLMEIGGDPAPSRARFVCRDPPLVSERLWRRRRACDRPRERAPLH